VVGVFEGDWVRQDGVGGVWDLRGGGRKRRRGGEKM